MTTISPGVSGHHITLCGILHVHEQVLDCAKEQEHELVCQQVIALKSVQMK